MSRIAYKCSRSVGPVKEATSSSSASADQSTYEVNNQAFYPSNLGPG
jgi:hypothetical protein